MCDQTLKSVLVPLNQVGSRTVFRPYSQVAKPVRSILHLALVLAVPWWGLRHFYYHWFSFLVHNSGKSLSAVLQHVSVVPSQPQRLCHVPWATWMCLRAVPGGAMSSVCMWQRELFLSFSSAVLQIILRSCLGRCLSVSAGKHQRILIVERTG